MQEKRQQIKNIPFGRGQVIAQMGDPLPVVPLKNFRVILELLDPGLLTDRCR